MDEDNKFDLSNVNKTKKQFKVPKLKNPFKKKSAGPGRDEFGQFTSGSGGLLQNTNFKWSRAFPFILIVALTGGYLVYRSLAGTYSACYDTSRYDAQCLTESDQASIARLYFGVLGRVPDKSGIDYWSRRLSANDNTKLTLDQIAARFMGSSEFKNKYGTLSNQKFVEAMYPQVFERAPDAEGLKYWVDKLNTKTITREKLMVGFTQSPEMKSKFIAKVAEALDLQKWQITSTTKKYRSSEVICYGTKAFDTRLGKDACKIDYDASHGSARISEQQYTLLAGVNFASVSSGKYAICFDWRIEGIGTTPIQSGGLSPRESYTNLGLNVNDLTLSSGNTYSTANSGANYTKSCNTFMIAAGKTKSVAFTPLASHTSTNGAKGRAYIALDTIELKKETLTQLAQIADQNPTIYSQTVQPGPKYTIRNNTITSNYLWQTYSASSENTQPVFKARFKGVKGENRLFPVGRATYGTAKVKTTVKPQTTQGAIATVYDTTRTIEGTKRKVAGSTITLNESEYIDTITFSLARDEEVDVEFEVLEGRFTFNDTGIYINLY